MGSSDKKFSRSHGDAKKPINSKGLPLDKDSTPGYTGPTGTPRYIQSAVSRAERHAGSCGTGGGKQGESPSHRQSGHYDTGSPSRGKAPSLQDPQKNVRETR